MTSLSTIVAGLWRLAEWDLDAGALGDWMAACVDMGVTTFDLAEVYGGHSCEARVGQALASRPGLRKRMQLVTKFGIRVPCEARPEVRRHHYDASAKQLKARVQGSLAELGVERLDAMLVHRADLLLDADELCAAAQELIEAGDVGAVGVSNFRVAQVELLAQRLGRAPFTNQVETSLLCLDAFQDGTLDQAARLRMPVMGWSPLGGGRLFDPDDPRAQRLRPVLEQLAQARGTTVDGVAYAFLLRHPAGIHPITGTRHLERIRAAVDACSTPLEREDWYALWTASTGEALA